MPQKPHWPDARFLDRFRSLKVKLAVLVAAVACLAALIIWFGSTNGLGPIQTVPLAIVLCLLLIQLISHGMTRPLREMIDATSAMASGDYSQRVRATSRDEVGTLAVAFNAMAAELGQQEILRRDLIANVSHELRTPLAAIQAQLENIVDGVTEPDPAALEVVLTHTERLGRLLEDLLDMSRIEAGADPLDTEDIELARFLDDAAADMFPIAAGKGVQIQIDVDPADLRVNLNVERMNQVMTNLLDNAVRHTGEDTVVTVSGYAERGWVVIEVLDQGPGIAPADRERIFNRFERSGSADPATGGTGLGLAIVRWVVGLHGGNVMAADSSVGARMRVRLPR
jgi:signal transduction histidine kinase